MNRQAFLAIAVAALAASTGARADNNDPSQYVLQFQGNRARAEVQAEAVQAVVNRNYEPNGSRVAARVNSDLQRAVVRQQTAEAVRRGEISYGEVSPG